MRLKIVQAGDPVLRTLSSELTQDQIVSPAVQQLIDYMIETMRDAPGVGLAAPQIGVALQVAVIEDRMEYMSQIDPEILAERGRAPVPLQVIVNPSLTILEESPVEFFEGCLSVAGFCALVPRARRVKVDCLDRHGLPVTIEANGWFARILQHEIDHLQGRLYLDRMWPRSFTTTDNLNRRWKEKSPAAVRAALGSG